MSQEINQNILAALEAGYGPQDILDAFSKSSNAEHKSWYENYTQNMRDRAKETSMIGTGGTPGLGLMGRVKKHIHEASDEQLLAEGALAAGGYAVGKRLLNKALPSDLAEQNRISRERLEFEKEQAAKADIAKLDKDLAKQEFNQAKQQTATVADAQKRIEAFNNLQQQKAAAQAPVAPVATPQPTIGIEPPKMGASMVSPEQLDIGLLGKSNDEFRAAVSPVTQAVETGQSPTKSIQADIAPLVDQAAPPPAEKSVQSRTRRTAEQIAADKASIAAAAPEGFHPYYTKRAGEMGPGAYSHLYNTMGSHEKAMKYWEEAVGKKNMAYEPFMEKFQEGVGNKMIGPKIPLPPGTKSAANAGRPTYVPEYIKGNVGIAPLAGMALLAPALAHAQSEAQKGNTAPAKELGFDLSSGALLAKILGGPAGLAAALGLGSKTLASGTLDSPEARALGVAPR